MMGNMLVTFPVGCDAPRRAWLSEGKIPKEYYDMNPQEKKQGLNKARTPAVDHYLPAQDALDLQCALSTDDVGFDLDEVWNTYNERSFRCKRAEWF